MKNLNELTLKESLDQLSKKEISSVELIKSCLTKSEEENARLNAYVTLFHKKAIEDAQNADKLRKSSEEKPLLGIPFAVKDNFLTKGQRTTASSKVLDQYIPQYDSTVVAKLKEAGAIIIGKTNMDAWAHGSSTETSDYGPSLNPHDSTKLSGGSSGGSAVAIAANLTIAAIGSETAGSIRQPSSWCGIVGLKPTYGRVSRYGVVAMGSSLDSPGPMTKTVFDSAYILRILAGQDSHDATTSPLSVENYVGGIKDSVKGLVVGLPKEYFMSDAQKGVNEMVRKTASKLEKLGAKLTEISLMDPKYSIAEYTIIQRSEVSSNLSRYTGVRYGNDRSYFGEEAKRRIMLGTYALSSGYYDAYYKKAQKVRSLMKQDFDNVFEKVDIILSPTTPTTAMPIGATEGQAMFGEMADVLAEASSLAGLPAINIPIGLINGLPVGMQLIGNHFKEQSIINAAHVLELNTNWKENI